MGLKKKSFITVILFVSLSAQAQVNDHIRQFASGLDSLRIALKIPAMSAALKLGDSIVFEEGFGYADITHHQKATVNTCYRIASITKTFTSTLVMQLVEKGKLDLDSPISAFGLDLGNPGITVRHLITHTSEGKPGSYFQYNGYRYGKLGLIIEKVAGLPFYRLLMENIVQPLNMSFTAPGFPLRDTAFDFYAYTQQRKDMLPYFENSFSQLAKPYELNDKGEIIESHYLEEFGAFGGLASNVTDLLKYSTAIDSNRFVSSKTQAEIFTPNRTTTGDLTPYGLGWFVQRYRGIDFYWHYGQTQGESGLLVKIPAKKLTLVVLANTDELSRPFPLGDGDLLMSPVGQLLFKYCVNLDHALRLIDYDLPVSSIAKNLFSTPKNTYKDFYNKELIVHATILNLQGDSLKAVQLYKIYADLNFDSGYQLPRGKMVAALKNMGINQDSTKWFTLTKTTKLRVYGVGEDCSGDFSTWCDFGWIEDSSGKMIWQMQAQPAEPAGGARKNQRVEADISLPAGSYRLRYKSDSGHAYNNWDSLPPDNFFWGIILLSEE